MSELWGFQSGQSQRQADDQSKGLYELRMAEGSIDLQTKQLTYQNAALTQQRQEQAIKMMQMANSKDGGSSTNPAEEISGTLMKLARIDIEAGLPEQGLSAIKSAVSLQANHSKIVEQTTQDQIRKFSFLSNSLTEVNDQASWDQAKMIFQSNFPGQLDQRIAGLPYSPQLIKQLTAGTQTALQKANTELSKARAGDVKANEAAAKARPALIAAQTRLDNDRSDALEKTGGGAALPKPAAVNRAKDLIAAQYPDIDKADLNIQALHVARLSKKYQDEGVDPTVADKRAFNKASEGGRFAGLRSAHVRGGTSTKNPLQVPLKGGKPDLTTMEDNAIYDGKLVGHPGEFYFFDKARGGLVKITEGDTSEDEPDDDSNQGED